MAEWVRNWARDQEVTDSNPTTTKMDCWDPQS